MDLLVSRRLAIGERREGGKLWEGGLDEIGVMGGNLGPYAEGREANGAEGEGV